MTNPMTTSTSTQPFMTQTQPFTTNYTQAETLTTQPATYNPSDISSTTSTMYEQFAVKLDTVNDIPLYNNLFNSQNNLNLPDYLKDNYNNNKYSTLINITNKLNDISVNKQLSTGLTNNEYEYKSIKELNNEIEKEISNMNLGINAKNDKMLNGLDKMRIGDMSHDYFVLKNLSRT